MDPELFKVFCEEFTGEMNRLRMEGRASIDSAQTEVQRIQRELEKIMTLISSGRHAHRHGERAAPV